MSKIRLQSCGSRGSLGLLAFGTGGLLISLGEYNQYLWLYLAPMQWAYLIIAVVGIFLFMRQLREATLNRGEK
ncbi:hypothetical protein skT53_32760 [Effusibacillus dendaii]|uniref:Uncharacterized protein n=1 Tax=Effusibacillus dendaii TaxID=2743772 RepID=A0A7I8DK59_9BACL|nr:hypothetical protein skT53_32760 [Effusibacillus dendaii]